MSTKDSTIKVIEGALLLISRMTVGDLQRLRKSHQGAKGNISPEAVTALLTPLASQISPTALSTEEKRRRKNEAQKLVRAAPEGRAKANEASRKSIAARKHAEAVKALIAERIKTQLEAKGRR